MRRAGAFLLLAGAAWAADPTPAPAPAAPDAAAAAQQDLADIRAAALPTEGAAALPNLNLQDVGPLPGLPVPSALLGPDAELGPDGLKKKKAGTGNWLVDAMEKQEKDDREAKADKSPGRGKDREEQLKADLELLRGDEKGAGPADRDAAPVESARPKAEAAEAPPPAYNPLDAFMAGWISAQDHDLLVPARAEGPAGEPGRGRLDGLELAPGDPAEGLRAAPEAPGLGDLRAAPNPYLVELDLPPPTAAGFAAPVLPAFAPADLSEPIPPPVVSGADARPDAAAHTFIPDFAQPTGDDKYFPQLKKF